MENIPKYNTSNIKILSALDAIRRRPGMYIGDTKDGTGLANLVLEVVNFCLDDLNNNLCKKISIEINKKNTVEVTANGRVLPVHEVDGKPFVENLMSKLTNSKSYLVIVNALSSKVLVSTTRDGYVWNQEFIKGTPSKLKQTGKANYTGTTIRFQPDKKYFQHYYFNQIFLTNRLQELSYFNKNLKIIFEDRSIRKSTFYNPQGLKNCLLSLSKKTQRAHEIVLGDIIEINSLHKHVELNIALAFTTALADQLSFVNGNKSIGGGTHHKGFIAGVAQAINKVSGCRLNASIWKRFITQGVFAVVSVKLPDPKYVNSTKDYLNNKEIYKITKTIVAKQLTAYFTLNNFDISKVVDELIHKYLNFMFRKKTGEIDIPTSSFVKNILPTLFIQPEKYKHIYDYYLEFEANLAACINIQNEKDE